MRLIVPFRLGKQSAQLLCIRVVVDLRHVYLLCRRGTARSKEIWKFSRGEYPQMDDFFCTRRSLVPHRPLGPSKVQLLVQTVMPLVIFSGLPSSGKTTRALQLQQALEDKIASSQRKFKVHIINDDILGINREVYRGTNALCNESLTEDAKSEKAARGTFYSAVQRALSKDDIVVADGMNYIKGFRYQLFCEAKALSTPHCVVSQPFILIFLH